MVGSYKPHFDSTWTTDTIGFGFQISLGTTTMVVEEIATRGNDTETFFPCGLFP